MALSSVESVGVLDPTLTTFFRLMVFCEKSTDMCVCASMSFIRFSTVALLFDRRMVWFCPNVATDIDRHKASVHAVLLSIRFFIVLFIFMLSI